MFENENNHNLKILKEWLKSQTYLPQNISDLYLTHFLLCTNSIETAKNLIDLCFTLRSQVPEIFDDRDPKDPSIQNIINITCMVPLPKHTKEKYQISIFKLTDPNPDKFIHADLLKTFFMFIDLRMITEDNLPDGEIPIFDMIGLTLRHLTKISMYLLKKYMQYTQEAHPVKLKQIHVINSPTFLDKIMALIRPFLKAEIAQMIHFHSSDYSTLYEFVPKELLPEEYGGNCGKLSELQFKFTEKLMKNRDVFLDETRWKIDETKRPKKESLQQGSSFGVEGSFRTLDID